MAETPECELTIVDVKHAVQRQLGTNNFEVIHYEIMPASPDPLGFMGDHVRIVAKVSVGDKLKELKYFCKKIPSKVKSHREYAEGTRAYYKEIELYKTLFNDMQNAISSENIQYSRWRPSCFYARNWDLLIVEDLSLEGFYMLPERELMPMRYVKESIKTMANMHAASIIFEEKLFAGLCETQSSHYIRDIAKIANIGQLYPNLIFESECTDKDGHPGYAFWEAGIRGQEAVIDEMNIYTQEQKKSIKEKFGDTVRQVYRMLEPSERFRNVMIHADLWGNNLMFCDDESGNVKQAILVDFQMTRYAPPAQDLLMFLHIVQDKIFRNAHEQDLTELYYDCLTQALKREHLDVQHILPRQEYDESCHYYKRYAILNQLIFTQLSVTPPEICGKMIATSAEYDRIMYQDRSHLLVESFRSDQFCRDRASEAVIEVVETFHLL